MKRCGSVIPIDIAGSDAQVVIRELEIALRGARGQRRLPRAVNVEFRPCQRPKEKDYPCTSRKFSKGS